MSENIGLMCIVLVFSALLEYLSVYSFGLYIYLINLEDSQKLLIFIKCIFNTIFIVLILCNSALHNSTFGNRFQNLEIPQKAQGVTLGVTGKSVTLFVRKLVQSLGFRNHTRGFFKSSEWERMSYSLNVCHG